MGVWGDRVVVWEPKEQQLEKVCEPLVEKDFRALLEDLLGDVFWERCVVFVNNPQWLSVDICEERKEKLLGWTKSLFSSLIKKYT